MSKSEIKSLRFQKREPLEVRDMKVSCITRTLAGPQRIDKLVGQIVSNQSERKRQNDGKVLGKRRRVS